MVVQRSEEHVDVIFDDGDEETDLDVREVLRIPQRMQEGKIHDEAKPFWEKYQPDKGSSSSSRRVKKKSKKTLLVVATVFRLGLYDVPSWPIDTY